MDTPTTISSRFNLGDRVRVRKGIALLNLSSDAVGTIEHHYTVGGNVYEVRFDAAPDTTLLLYPWELRSVTPASE